MNVLPLGNAALATRAVSTGTGLMGSGLSDMTFSCSAQDLVNDGFYLSIADVLSFREVQVRQQDQLSCCNQAAIKTRWRNSSKLPRPYIERLINLRRLICPSTGPVLYG